MIKWVVFVIYFATQPLMSTQMICDARRKRYSPTAKLVKHTDFVRCLLGSASWPNVRHWCHDQTLVFCPGNQSGVTLTLFVFKKDRYYDHQQVL